MTREQKKYFGSFAELERFRRSAQSRITAKDERFFRALFWIQRMVEARKIDASKKKAAVAYLKACDKGNRAPNYNELKKLLGI
jgi:hypothetical protein